MQVKINLSSHHILYFYFDLAVLPPYTMFMKPIPKVALFLESSRQYGRDMISGIAKYAMLHGPWVFYKEDFFYNYNKHNFKDFFWLKRWGANGVICRDFMGMHKLQDLKIPIISVAAFEENLEEIYQVITDYKKISKMAFDCFVAHGFRNFAFCGFKDMSWSVRRNRSFAQIVKDAGFTIDSYNSKSKRLSSWDKEYPNLIKWLESLKKPTAILCCNDDRGSDILEACKSTGIKVPFEVAVLGIDNDPQVCELTNPSLSSIKLDIEKSGFLTAKLLDHLMSGQTLPKFPVIVSPVEICERQSTQSMAISDQKVVKALQFIADNSNNIISVDDVLNYVECSRKLLDDKFKKKIGTSVFDEIRRTRINSMCKLLLRTNYSISDIALSFGYNDADHISRFFKKIKGMTLLEYRKKYTIEKA